MSRGLGDVYKRQEGVMVQEKVCLNQCTAAVVCGEVMVRFGKEEEER